MKKTLAIWLLILSTSGPTWCQAQPPAPSALEQTLQFVLDGQLDSALEMLNRYIEQNPADPRGYRARAALLANLLKEPDHLAAALSDYNRVLELDSRQSAMFWLQRGRLLHRMDRHLEAIRDLTGFLASDSAYPDAYFLRARSHWLLGHGQAACQDLDKALQLSPLMSEAYGLRAIVHLQLGHPDQGLADLKTAVDLNPHSPYKADLDAIRTRKIAADGMSWVPFVSPQRDFQIELPMPVRTTVRNDQFMVASALGAGHMYGVIRHPHDDQSRLWKIESEECRQAVFTFLEVSGGKVTRWNIERYAGRRCLHACVRGSDGGETDVLVVLQPENIYLVAAVRPLDSPPFDPVRRARFFRSFHLLKK